MASGQKINTFTLHLTEQEAAALHTLIAATNAYSRLTPMARAASDVELALEKLQVPFKLPEEVLERQDGVTWLRFKDSNE